jgi:AcrR family transcriptional regulator
MTTVQSRDDYYETGLQILSELGFSGLKLAEVCRRLGVTSGSFYHYFSKWAEYLDSLLGYWREARTVKLIDALDSETDPRLRLARIVDIGVALPHGAESAIRTWSRMDPQVREIQADVDRQRFDAVSEAVTEITGEPATADLVAHAAVYLLVGYEQSSLEPNTAALREIMLRLVSSLM